MKAQNYAYKNLTVTLYQTPGAKSLRLKKYLEAALPVFGNFLRSYAKGEGELSLTLCGKAKIRSLNAQYRAKDKATDVLSFPLYDNLRKTPEKAPLISLGDIFICHEVARRQAKSFQVSYEDEVTHLFVHGFLHLLGYDHEISAKEEKLMRELEDQLLKKVSAKLRG